MGTSTVTLSPHAFSLLPQPKTTTTKHLHPNTILRFHTFSSLHLLQASRRIWNHPQESDHNFVNDRRNWSSSSSSSRGRGRGGAVSVEYEEEGDDYGDEDDDDDDDDEEDRSLDLLVKFMQNVFKKISKRARKAVRSVLPRSISTKLVGFSVNGVIMLAFLWILKAFLEVVCTLGSVVFVSILIIRGIWSGVSYLQESRIHKVIELDDNRAWTGARPAT